MSTKALLAVKTNDDRFFVKYSHYGLYSDYRKELLNASVNDFMTSIMEGSSSEPFRGSYLDFDHCKTLGWPESTFIEAMRQNCSWVCKSLKELFESGHEAGASYIYVKDAHDESLTIYDVSYDRDEYEEKLVLKHLQGSNEIDWSEDVFDIDTLKQKPLDEILQEIEEEFQFIEDGIYDPFCHMQVNAILNAHLLTEHDMRKIKTVDEAISFVKEWNKVAKALKEAIL